MPVRWTNTYGAVGVIALLGSVISLPGPSDEHGSSWASPSAAQIRKMASTHGTSGRLRHGCKSYRYSYKVSAPSDEWGLETFLIGPKGGRLGSDAILSGGDPRSGTKTWKICRTNTTPGRFTIKGRLTYNRYPEQYTGWIRPSHFTLTKKHH